MKKRIIGVGVACIATCIGIAGCGASSTQLTETTTTSVMPTTTAAEVTTTTEVTTTVTEVPTTITTTTSTTETQTTAELVQPDDDVLMKYLRDLYSNSDRRVYYSKFAIADFDADGNNELALEYNNNGERTIEIIDEEDLKLQYDAYTYIDNTFDSLTFLDNGIAYANNDNAVDFDNYDDKEYYLININWLQKLNYNLPNQDTMLERKIYYFEEHDSIFKNFRVGEMAINTQGFKNTNEIIPRDQCEQEIQMLEGGNVLNIEIKDFTAENIGL